MTRPAPRLTSALEAVNFDQAKLPPGALAAASSPAVQQANASIRAYNQTACGIAP